MSQYSRKDFKNLVEEFDKYAKRVLKTHISQVADTRERYIKDLIRTHNSIISYLEPCADDLNDTEQGYIKDKVIKVKQKVKRAFTNLICTIHVPQEAVISYIDAQVDTDSELDDTIIDVDGEEDLVTNASDPEDNTESEKLDQINNQAESQPTIQSQVENSLEVYTAMAATPEETRTHKKYLSEQFKGKYDGNSDELPSIIRIIDSIAEDTPANLVASSINWLVSRFTGRAAEAVPDGTETFAELKAGLKAYIKPDSVRELESRMVTLTLGNNAGEFAKKMDDLSEDLRKAYLRTGVPHAMALQMTIDKTIELCRAQARTTMVETAFQHPQLFTTPKEVTSKFVVESNKQKEKDAKTLTFRSQGRGDYRGRGQKRGRGGQNGRYNGSYQNNYQNGRQNWYQNQSGYGNSYRGRGRGRGRSYSRGRGNFYQQSAVRYTEAAPQQQQPMITHPPETTQQLSIRYD